MKSKPELRRCFVCDGIVSSAAAKCPHCGQSFRSNARPVAIVAVLLVVAAVLWAMAEGEKSDAEFKAFMRDSKRTMEAIERGEPTPVPVRLVR